MEILHRNSCQWKSLASMEIFGLNGNIVIVAIRVIFEFNETI